MSAVSLDPSRMANLQQTPPRAHCNGLNAPSVLARVPGLTYRQLDYWSRTERLVPHTHGGEHSSGIPYCWPLAEVEVASRMIRLIGLGVGLQPAVELARSRERLTAGSALLLRLAGEMAS